jgi:hypothetical protein
MVKLSAKLLGGARLWERNTTPLNLSASNDGSIPDAREPVVRAGYPYRYKAFVPVMGPHGFHLLDAEATREG